MVRLEHSFWPPWQILILIIAIIGLFRVWPGPILELLFQLNETALGSILLYPMHCNIKWKRTEVNVNNEIEFHAITEEELQAAAKLNDLLIFPSAAAPGHCVKSILPRNSDDCEPDLRICTAGLIQPCTIFSFGVNYNWDFDDAALKLGCRVYSFDPSMRPGNYSRGLNHTFLPIGIGPRDELVPTHSEHSTIYTWRDKGLEDTSYEVRTLRTIMEDLHVERLDVLRMDVEGSEWEVLEQISDSNLWPVIDQLLLEVHMWNGRPKSSGGTVRWARALAGIPLHLFHAARNFYDSTRVTDKLTAVYELGFVKAVSESNLSCQDA